MIPFISNLKRGKLAEEDRRQNTRYLRVRVDGTAEWNEEGGSFGRYWKYSISM